MRYLGLTSGAIEKTFSILEKSAKKRGLYCKQVMPQSQRSLVHACDNGHPSHSRYRISRRFGGQSGKNPLSPVASSPVATVAGTSSLRSQLLPSLSSGALRGNCATQFFQWRPQACSHRVPRCVPCKTRLATLNDSFVSLRPPQWVDFGVFPGQGAAVACRDSGASLISYPLGTGLHCAYT